MPDQTSSPPGTDSTSTSTQSIGSTDLAGLNGNGRPASSYVPMPLQVAAAYSWRLILVILGLGIIIWAASSVYATVILPALIALLLAALLAPVVNWLVRMHLPRGIAVITTVIGFILLILGLLTIVGQQLAEGFQQMRDQVSHGLDNIDSFIKAGPFGLSSSQASDMLAKGLEQLQKALNEHSSDIVGGAVGAATGASEFLIGVIVALFTTVFFLLDGKLITSWIMRLLPEPARARTAGALVCGWDTLAHYTRVQILVAAIDAVGITIGAAILQIPAPLLLPVFVLVFLVSFVPLVGAVLSGLLVCILALVTQGWVAALVMLGIVIVVHQVEAHGLQPFIMGRAVAVHPLAVVLGVAAGTALMGISGALLAVPAIATINRMVVYLVGRDPGPLETNQVANFAAQVVAWAGARRRGKGAGVSPDLTTSDGKAKIDTDAESISDSASNSDSSANSGSSGPNAASSSGPGRE
ncbi:AI-2E family transporter [Devriesea agamarum]|uniref:AI-2E family transporter n=1 Tax=Devriesea agamarum TaxID=472569 RepID=UPI00071C876B|nr:AI-2E family transporter [Devriesea agamarum]